MSADQLDGFETPDVSDSDDDGTIRLDPGEVVVGEITDCNLGAGDHGLIEIDGQTLWLNYTMRKQLEQALISGSPVAHVKLEETESFEDDDGETHEYNPRELRFRSGDGDGD